MIVGFQIRAGVRTTTTFKCMKNSKIIPEAGATVRATYAKVAGKRADAEAEARTGSKEG